MIAPKALIAGAARIGTGRRAGAPTARHAVLSATSRAAGTRTAHRPARRAGQVQSPFGLQPISYRASARF